MVDIEARQKIKNDELEKWKAELMACMQSLEAEYGKAEEDIIRLDFRIRVYRQMGARLVDDGVLSSLVDKKDELVQKLAAKDKDVKLYNVSLLLAELDRMKL